MFLPVWKNLDGLRDMLVHIVRSKSVVVREKRPIELTERNDRVLKALFGKDEAFLYKTSRTGEKTKTRMMLDLEALSNVWVFDASVAGGAEAVAYPHYCYAEEGSDACLCGAEVGDPCCEDASETTATLVTPLINWLVHRHWEDSEASRWFYNVKIFKKY